MAIAVEELTRELVEAVPPREVMTAMGRGSLYSSADSILNHNAVLSGNFAHDLNHNLNHNSLFSDNDHNAVLSGNEVNVDPKTVTEITTLLGVPGGS